MKKPLAATGLSGLVGSRFIELYGDGFDLDHLDLTTGIDITDSQKVFRSVARSRAEALIHMASFTDVSRAYQETGDRDGAAYRVNVLGTRAVARACAQYGTYLIHISTDFVFSGTKQEPYTEEDDRSPIEWYGQTKAWAEEEVESSGAPFCIVRIAFPFRAAHDERPDIVRKIVSGLKSRSLPPQFTDTVITPTFIDDVALGLSLMLEKKPQGIFHCVGSTHISPYELAVSVARRFDFAERLVKKGSYREYLKSDPRPRQQHLALSNRKIQHALAGFTPKTLLQALEEIKNQ